MQLYLAQLLPQQVPLLCEGFTELLLVSDQQRQFADGTVQQVFRTLLHGVAESVRLADQHAPGLLQRTQEHRQTVVAEKCCSLLLHFKAPLAVFEKKTGVLYLLISSSPNSVSDISVLDLPESFKLLSWFSKEAPKKCYI